MTLRAQLLGEFRVWQDDQELTPLLTHLGRPKTLMKILLAYPGRVFARDELIEWLWPNLTEHVAASNLRKRISELRQVLEPHLQRGSASRYILSQSSGYCFNENADYLTDTQEFSEKVRAGETLESAGQWSKAISEYEAALALAQGDLLAEDRYEPWALDLSREWEDRVLTLCERLADGCIRLGRYDQAREHCSRGLKRRPWSEQLYRQKMRSHYYAGQHTEAIQAFHECVQKLNEVLGVEPSQETQALSQKMLRQEMPELPKVIPHNLPLALTSFIGREHEIIDIKRLFTQVGTNGCSPLHRLVTLTGPGGCGKTRLALEIATRISSKYADGVWLVDLAILTDPALVPQAVADALGLRETPSRPLIESIADHLRLHTALLLLDNSEHLIKACAELADFLLRTCPKLQILVTSREALGMLGETVWLVPPMSVPPLEPLPPPKILREYEAVALFVERAKANQPAFSLTPENAAAVASICAHLDGIPLALELAAACTSVLSMQQIVDRLNDRFTLLTAGDRTAPRHQQTLRATLDWSYSLLSNFERVLLQRLSVFVGDFTLEAAESVCIWQKLKSQSAIKLLTQLVDKSLVMAETQDREARYRLLETVRQYAQEKLVAARESKRILERHLSFYLDMAEQAESHLQGPSQAFWLVRLESEHPNLRAALDYSAQSYPEFQLRLAVALRRFWSVRGHWSEGRRQLSEALVKNQDARGALQAKALVAIGNLARDQGDFESARALYEESLTLSKETADRRGIAESLHHLGQIAHDRGDHALARSYYEQSLTIRRELEDKPGLGASLQNLGLLAFNQGDYAAARSFQEESLRLRRERGDLWGIAASLHSLGMVAQHQGDAVAARSYYEQSLEIKRELRDKWGVSASLNNLGMLAYNQREFSTARSYFEQSLELKRELGDKRGIANSLNNLGLVSNDQGDLDGARVRYEESLVIKREMGDKRGIAGSLHNLGVVAFDQEKYDLARDLHIQSLTMRSELGDQRGLAAVVEGLARICVRQGQLEKAVRLLGARAALCEAIQIQLLPLERDAYEAEVQAARAKLGEAAFLAQWAAGRAMTLEQAIDYAHAA
jgi:predicted ATPase/DNA-binding SARP family transcriptional activator